MKTKTVVIANVAETFVSFLSREDDPETRSNLIYSEQRLGDRALYWLTDDKLVITPDQIPHLEYAKNYLGYLKTEVLSPITPTNFLCDDILREYHIFEQIVDYSRDCDVLQLIPYATTSNFLELARKLSRSISPKISLPESPKEEMLWLRDYADTKIGFRFLASQLEESFGIKLPFGYGCANSKEAAQAVQWFADRGLLCVVKANCGENGIGNSVFHPSQFDNMKPIQQYIDNNCFFRNDLLIVEEYIDSKDFLSPSIEFFIPGPDSGRPRLTYLCNQVFRSFGDFCGIEINSQSMREPWYPMLFDFASLLAQKLQESGYVGSIDLDAVVDNDGDVFPLEVNTRRTGGTHVHEFANFVLGSEYAEKYVVLSDDALPCNPSLTFEDVLQRLEGVLFAQSKIQAGIVPSVTSCIRTGMMGSIIIGESHSKVWELRSELIHRLAD